MKNEETSLLKNQKQESDQLMNNEDNSIKKRKHIFRALWIGAGILFLLLLGIGAYLYFSHNEFSQASIFLQITAPSQAASGDNIVWSVAIKNNANIAIDNVILNFEYPIGVTKCSGDSTCKKFQSSKIGSILPGEEKDIKFTADISGEINELKTAKASITYNPRGISASFTNDTQTIVQLTSGSAGVKLSAVKTQILAGEDVVLNAVVSSNIENPLGNLQLKMYFPDGVQLVSSLPQASNVTQSAWNIGVLNPKEVNSFVFHLKMKGNIGASFIVKAEVSYFDSQSNEQVLLDEDQLGFKLTEMKVSLVQTINNEANYTAHFGETLSYKIDFQNQGNSSYQNSDLLVVLDSNALDLASIVAPGAMVSGNKITFPAANFPQLAYIAPNSQGEVMFSVKVKSPNQITGSTTKNFVINETVGLGTLIEKSWQIKIISQPDLGLTFSLAQGTFPPASGQTATIVAHLLIYNFGNNLSGVVLDAIMGDNVVFQGIASPSDVQATFDATQNKLHLDFGSVSAQGARTIAKDVALTVAINGTITGGQTVSVFQLFKTATFSAQDTFCQQTVSLTVNSLEQIDSATVLGISQ